jgi:hypothetical protein
MRAEPNAVEDYESRRQDWFKEPKTPKNTQEE